MEKNKSFINSVTLSGTLMELDKTKVRRGTLDGGNDYVSFNGKMDCGGNIVSFSVFASSKKFDGSPSKNYESINKWLDDAVPKVLDNVNATKATMVGSLGDNPWPDKSGIIREDVKGTSCNIRFINPYDGKDQCFVSLDCYIDSITEETANGDLTGRKNMTVLSHDFSNKAIKIIEVKVPEGLAEDIKSAGWEPGVTAKINMDIMTISREKENSTVKGFGKQAPVSNSVIKYTELVVVGGDPAYEEDSVSSFKSEDVKELKALKAIQNGKAGSKNSDDGRVSETKKTKTATTSDEDDEFEDEGEY